MGVPGQLYKETVNVTKRSSPQLVFIFIVIFWYVSTAAVVKSERLLWLCVKPLTILQMRIIIPITVCTVYIHFMQFHFCMYEYNVVLQMKRHITCNSI
jgi:hypothetical protein